MLILQNLFQLLSRGVLSNLALANEGDGTIKTASQAKITDYVNEGLLRLYSRFVLKEQDVLIEQHEHITFYHLLPRFAVNHVPANELEDEPIRYILDLPKEKFEGDVLRILSVFNSDGCKLPLNDDGNCKSLFTPQANILQVPDPVPEKALNVLYQAKHKKLLGELEEQIHIPDVLLEALLSFIAYKVFSHMNSQDSSAKSREYLAMYEAICTETVGQDLVSTSISTTPTRFESRGWV